ncbi:MAG TPA: hypothetical protein VLA78_10275 [Paracoccaceae bacterium]|nr:hypothetical protein [Paracoccaceae bacterium]
MNTRRLMLVTATALALAAPALAQQGMGMMGMHHGGGGHAMGHGMMPMLNGTDTTPEEVHEMEAMFMHFPDIRRSVENLPDGIRTVTESDDPYLRGFIVSHVTGMITRVEEGRDPGVPIQSPTLAILFEKRALIDTVLEPTDTGIVVIQTSADPEVVAALQTHAAEVSDMAARGMEPVHERMMGAAPARP